MLTSVVRQDQMRVAFPVTQRQILEFRRKAASNAVDQILVRLRLPDGTIHDQTGKVNFLDVQTDKATDTVLVQAVFPTRRRSVRWPVRRRGGGGGGSRSRRS